MSEVLIQSDRVSKKYCRSLKQSLWYGVRDIAGELLGRGASPSPGDDEKAGLRPSEFWALKDVSFELKRGECLGLIGPNGAGKSTLLKVLNGLIKPDAGQVRIRGRVGALIELGAGFHPLLSGRENIYVNAAILGVTKREVDRRLDEIIEFAEIGDALDAPVQSYSSGMRVRLGFATAASLRPDVLLLDEVLAVGDAGFRAKCYQHLTRLREQGVAFILVSHSSQVIAAMCDRAICLEHGRMLRIGDTHECLTAYEKATHGGPSDATAPNGFWKRRPSEQARSNRSPVAIESISLCDRDGCPVSALTCGRPGAIRIVCSAREDMNKLALAVRLRCGTGADISLHFDSGRQGQLFEVRSGQSHAFLLSFPIWVLRPGVIGAKIGVYRHPFEVFDMVEGFALRVVGDTSVGEGLVYQPHLWQQLQPGQDSEEFSGDGPVDLSTEELESIVKR